MRDAELAFVFVDAIPRDLERGILYISIPFATALHRCCCGCGREVVTPLAPRGWTLSFDGDSVSLNPSIGNWSFPCQSHYWIHRNHVEWADRWSRRRINALREAEQQTRVDYFEQKSPSTVQQDHGVLEFPEIRAETLWRKLKTLFRSF